ncbi:uncharacterized protein [Haliotis cracherodii]|uniref:uncharacterized protein n=1 Tax=Haliotis cracherodii TaxID=6455 RepID=UPI0039ECFC55
MARHISVLKHPAVLLIATLASVCVCRQMCYSCNYVGNILSQGYECVSYPKNWTYGNWRLRCNNKCTTQSTYDKETGKATFMARGCSGSMKVPEDYCEEDDFSVRCYFTCEDHYCNDGPGIDDSFLEIISDGGGAASRVSLITVLLETLVAFFIKMCL